MLSQPKKETTGSKELNSKDKKKMWHPDQEDRRKEGCQILKDKQQVRKKEKKMFDTKGPRTKKEKIEQENREEGMKRKRRKNVRHKRHHNEKGKIRTRESRRRHEKEKKKDKIHCSLYKFYVFFCRF